MTKIKLCGLSRPCDIEAVNELKPEYIGFVFAQKSKRCVSPKKAAELKKLLAPNIRTVGVFVDETAEAVAQLFARNIIDIAQLHGNEDDAYIRRLRALSGKPVIKAFRITSSQDILAALESAADFVLLDSGAGTGSVFDWKLIQNLKRPYFLAGGLTPSNAALAVNILHPFAVDVSSGIETDGVKDKSKMESFIAAVRNNEY